MRSSRESANFLSVLISLLDSGSGARSIRSLSLMPTMPEENVLFPYLEKNGITGPPSVMWGIHDVLRADLREISQLIIGSEKIANPSLNRAIADKVIPTLNQISEMIYKEENILLPMCMETLTADEWDEVAKQLKDPEMATYKAPATAQDEAAHQGLVNLDVGALTQSRSPRPDPSPLDVTYVDEKDEVKYFSLQGAI